MERRTLLSLPLGAFVLSSGAASAGPAVFESYTRAAYDQAMAAGEPLLLDFYAGW